MTEKYKLTTDDLSWRGAVARFIRVYKRETLDEERPLRSANDGGTGAQYRGVVTFDLANMAEGVIPFIVHDSVMLKHIEKKVVSEIIRAYDATKTSGQQVFIAFDSMESYSSQTREILNKNKVLELSPKDGALFGRVWNISDTETGAEDNRR